MEETVEVSPSMAQKRSSRNLSRYNSSQANISNHPLQRLNSGEESDEEYGDIDKGFSLSTVNYPAPQQLPRPRNQEPTTADTTKSSNVVNVVYAPVRLGSQLSNRSLQDPDAILPAPGELSGRSPPSSFYARAAAPGEAFSGNRELSKTTSWRSVGSAVELDELLSRGYTPEQAAEICRRRAKVVENGISLASSSREIRKTYSAPIMMGKKPSSEYERMQQLQMQAVARHPMYLRPELARSRSPKLSPTQSRSSLPQGILDGQDPYTYGTAPVTSATFSGSDSDFDEQGLGLRVPSDQTGTQRTAFAEKRSTSAPQNSLPRLYSPQQSFRVASPAASSRPHAVPAAGSERDARDVARLISEQIAIFGVSMYNTLTESDEGPLQHLVSCGMTMDEAILHIFESKGYTKRSSQKAATQRMPSRNQIDFLDEHGNEVVVDVSDDDSQERDRAEGRAVRDQHVQSLHNHAANPRPLSSRTFQTQHHPPLPPYHLHQDWSTIHASHPHSSHGHHQPRHPAAPPSVPYYVKYHQLHVQAQAMGMTQAPPELLASVINVDSSELETGHIPPPPTPALDSHTSSSDAHEVHKPPSLLSRLSFGIKSASSSPKNAASPQGECAFFPATEPAVATTESSSPPQKEQLLPGLKVSHSFKSMIGLASKIKLDKTKEEKALQRKLKYKDSDVITLINMGFTKEQSIQALVENNNNVQRSASSLLCSNR